MHSPDSVELYDLHSPHSPEKNEEETKNKINGNNENYESIHDGFVIKKTKNKKHYNGVYGFRKDPLKVGNCYAFLYKNNRPIFILGPNYCTSFITLLAFTLFFLLLIVFFFNNTKFSHKLIVICSYSCLCFFHLYTMFINPGMPSYEYSNKVKQMITKKQMANKLDNNVTELQGYSYCEECKIYSLSSDSVEHCNHCNLCYFKIDHHCEFTGHCIAKNNLWSFYCFLAFIVIYFVTFFWFIINKSYNI